MKRFFKSKKGQKGFTLIELLVVIAILGVLAGIGIPNITNLIGKGVEEAAATELANVQTAVLAGMVDAEVITCTGDGADMTFGPTDDFTIRAAAGGDLAVVLSSYILGSDLTVPLDIDTGVEGTYTIASDGAVTQDSYPGL